jgi:hypothetical protein
MQKPQRLVPWISGALALAGGLVFVAITVPNYAPHPVPIYSILAVAFAPALCIFTFGRRWTLFNWLAWAFLSVLLVCLFMR